MPPDKAQEVPQDSSGHLGNYLKIIDESPMVPAFSANIRELIGVLEDPYYPVLEVSRIILRDVSLTTQILKLVNSIYFQSRQRQVHTISSAVMIVGFEVLRDLAVGLKLFENFQKSASLNQVKKLIFQSFFMALSAQELAQQDQRFNNEELFLTALLYNFGELVAAHYFPEEYQRVLELVQETQISKSAAVKQVFQFSLEDLGEALLKNWNFPERLCARLTDLKLPGGDSAGPQGNRSRFFKRVHDLSQALLDSDVSPERRQKLQEKMARDLGIESEALERSLAASKHRLQDLTRVLKLDIKDLKLSLPSAEPEEAEAVDQIDQGETAVAQPEKPPVQDSQGPDHASNQELQSMTFLLQVIEEINQAIASHMPIHQVIMMILEGIFQGVGFDRVVFCVVDRQRTWISGRFGIGEKVEALLPLLKAPFASKQNPLSLSLAQGREYLVCPESSPQDRQLMKEEFWQASKAQAILVSPILIDSAPLGVIYMDRLKGSPAITALDRQRMQSFRDLTAIAIRLSSQRAQEGLSG
jgi:HD-like signal output (HDOD) protein